MSKYWMIVASLDHVQTGVLGGFAQACHGKIAPLKRMSEGDFLIYYSGKTHIGKPDKCQSFTALGQVVDETISSQKISRAFCPARIKVRYVEAKTVPISGMLDCLTFIKNKRYWGFPFRQSFFEISIPDFALIYHEMTNLTFSEEEHLMFDARNNSELIRSAINSEINSRTWRKSCPSFKIY